MKKSVYLLVVLGMLMAGCTGSNNSGSLSQNVPNADFSFSDLRLNLSSIKEVGVYRKKTSSVMGRKQTSVISSTTQNDSYLVGFNAQGEEVPLVYLNSQNQEVTVPFSVFSLEVIGDFSYIVYYNSLVSTGLSSLESTFFEYGFSNGTGKSLGMTTFELLLKTYGPHTEGNPGAHAFIISHNASGKLFNAVEALSLNYFDDGNMQFTVDLKLFTPLTEKIIYFVKRTNTCKGELVFNETNKTLTKTEICTQLDINPIFVHNTGYFVYTLNDKIYHASPDFSITGDLTTNYFTGVVLSSKNTIFKSIGDSIVLLKPNTNTPSIFVVFDGEFNVVEEKAESLERGYLLVHSNWLTNINGYDYFEQSDNYFIYVNFETFEFGAVQLNSQFDPLQQFSSRYKYLVFDNNLYVIGTKIQSLTTENTFETLEDNVFEVKNDFIKILNEGYVEYSQISGLTQINKYLNLQTGEIYLESESRPTITVTQVQPIN